LKELHLLTAALNHRVLTSRRWWGYGILNQTEAGAGQLEDLAYVTYTRTCILPSLILGGQNLENGLLVLTQLLDQRRREGRRGMEPQTVSRGDEGHSTALDFEECLDSSH
jgi:hypothetical protein